MDEELTQLHVRSGTRIVVLQHGWMIGPPEQAWKGPERSHNEAHVHPKTLFKFMISCGLQYGDGTQGPEEQERGRDTGAESGGPAEA